jgi:20S proteasome subunit beta 6
MSLSFITPTSSSTATLRNNNNNGTSNPTTAPTQNARFSPYDWNGGAVVAVAGKGFVVLAADTRLATGYSIKTRKINRIHRLSPQTYVACGGCHADVINLYNELTLRATMYRHNHGTHMGTVAAAQLLSNTLYYRRFFPIYALAVVAGLDENGDGYCAGYDAVGSYIKSKEGYQANGSAASIIMPILDNALASGTAGYSGTSHPEYTPEQVVEIVKAAYVSAGEREIMVGDSIIIHVLRKDQPEQILTFNLKAD